MKAEIFSVRQSLFATVEDDKISALTDFSGW